MTSTEVVNIIKGMKGDINVVAKRNDLETINVTLYKDTINAKVGLTAVDRGWKVYRLLFENSGKVVLFF